MKGLPPLSVLVAFRDTSPEEQRTQSWQYLQGLYRQHLPAVEVVVGTDDGIDPFHKTLALNRAAAAASGEIFLIADSDTWLPTEQLLEAWKAISVEPESWWRPWTQKVKLGQTDTEALLAANDLDWDGQMAPGAERRLENRNTYWGAPPQLLTRAQFNRVHGFDERFRGWGQEDEAFALSLRAIVGRPRRLLGYCVHLWHPRIGRSGRDQWPGENAPGRNVELVRAYRQAYGPHAMAALVQGR